MTALDLLSKWGLSLEDYLEKGVWLPDNATFSPEELYKNATNKRYKLFLRDLKAASITGFDQQLNMRKNLYKLLRNHGKCMTWSSDSPLVSLDLILLIIQR